MSTYLLTCKCGKVIPVDVGQAGGRVPCQCGTELEVPTLRKLRHLPLAKSETVENRAAWNASKGVAAAGLILAALFAGYAGWNRYTEPAVPKLDPVGQTTMVNQNIDAMTPVQTWDRWVGVYQPLAESGFAVYEHPHRAAIEQAISQRHILQSTLLVIAAVCLAVALATAFWPRGITRAGDKGTRRHA